MLTEIRGVWLPNRPHSQVLASKQNIAEAMDFLQRYGFNLIFPVVWNRGYTLFPSQVMANYGFPIIEPFYQSQSRDPLAEIITEAHQRNIAVIPWFEYGFAASHLADGGHILQSIPTWKAIASNGEVVKHGGLIWMNAFSSEVQKLMLDLILEVVTQYQVEGIQGCDRFPALPVVGGYDRETIQLYQAQFGIKPPGNSTNKQWLQWRADLLTEFLTQVYQQVKAVNPQLIISLSPAVYPFCLNNLLQDTKSWVSKGLVDLIHPQIYRSSFGSYRQEVKQIKQNFPSTSRSKFIPGIAFTANNQDLSSKDLLQCLRLNRASGFSGEVFFHYEGLRKNNDAIATALYQSGGYDRVASLPIISDRV